MDFSGLFISDMGFVDEASKIIGDLGYGAVFINELEISYIGSRQGVSFNELLAMDFLQQKEKVEIAVSFAISNLLMTLSQNIKSPRDKALAEEPPVEGSPKCIKPSLPKGGAPKGNYEKPDINDPRPIMRQNETADLLASEGYDVEMLPNKKGGNNFGVDPTSNPDFLIENEVFDCYSPDTSNARNIRSRILSKTKKQATNVILNLDDCPVSIDDILRAIGNEPILELDKLMYVKDGRIFQVLPK